MGKKQFRINQLLIMENLNLFGKSKDQLITRLNYLNFKKREDLLSSADNITGLINDARDWKMMVTSVLILLSE